MVASEHWLVRWLRWGTLAVALSGIGYVAYGLTDIRTSIERMTVMADTPQQLTTSWRDTTGHQQEVVTPRNTGEGAGSWAARHKEGVDALQALYPVAA